MELVDNLRELGNNISENFHLENLQNNFLQNNIGLIANTAVDFGIRALMPDFVEDEVIEVKDAFVNGGLKEGFNKAIENAISVGKDIMGIGNSAISSIGQAKDILNNGELVKGLSKTIDVVLQTLADTDVISKNVANVIKSGKNIILDNIETNVENEFETEVKSLQKIEKYINNWEKYYNEKDVDGLNKEYNKIKKQMKNIMPLENILNNVKKIENINQLIKNNKDFDFSKYYLDLAEAI